MIFDLSKKSVALKNMYKNTLNLYEEYLDSNGSTNKFIKDCTPNAIGTAFEYAFFAFLSSSFLSCVLPNNFSLKQLLIHTFVVSFTACAFVGLVIYILALYANVEEAKKKYSDIESEYSRMCEGIDTFITMISNYELTLRYKDATFACKSYNDIIKCERLSDKRILNVDVDEQGNIDIKYADYDGSVLSDSFKFCNCKENIDLIDNTLVLNELGGLIMLKKVSQRRG